MRALILGSAAGLAGLAMAAGAMGAQPAPPSKASQSQAQARAQDQARAKPQGGDHDDDDKIVNVNDRPATVTSVVASPVEDLNLRKTPIPEVLAKAQENPYDLRGLERCQAIGAELALLDEALGADADAPPVEEDKDLKEKGVGLLRTGVQAVTPYRGLIRRLSGASAYEKKVQEAIEAGFARRGYLKGLGLKMNCAPPAAPAWFKPTVVRRPAPRPVRRR